MKMKNLLKYSQIFCFKEIESPKLFIHSADMCQKRPRFYRIDNSLIDRPPTPPPPVLEETFMWSLARTSCKLAEY